MLQKQRMIRRFSVWDVDTPLAQFTTPPMGFYEQGAGLCCSLVGGGNGIDKGLLDAANAVSNCE